MDKVTELPQGYQESKLAGREITISRADLPWMKEESAKVTLSAITLKGGKKFYLGSSIAHPTLIKEADRLGIQGEAVQNRANYIFYRELATYMGDEYNPNIPVVTYGVSGRRICYVKSAAGERVYFMELDKIGEERVILRIAACSKNGQDNVLRLIARR